jgi:hypothetical protein
LRPPPQPDLPPPPSQAAQSATAAITSSLILRFANPRAISLAPFSQNSQNSHNSHNSHFCARRRSQICHRSHHNPPNLPPQLSRRRYHNPPNLPPPSLHLHRPCPAFWGMLCFLKKKNGNYLNLQGRTVILPL